MKMCLCCKTLKLKDQFAKNKSKADGLQYRCKECAAKYRTDNRARILLQKQEHYLGNRDRLLSEKRTVYKEKRSQKLAYQKQYYQSNVEKCKETRKQFSLDNPNYYKEYRVRKYAQVNAKEAKRKTAKMQRTPAWLTPVDFERMRNVYRLAELQTKITGEPWHVDHIIPLQGELISGFHVPSNLEAIRGSDNCRKRNKFEVI